MKTIILFFVLSASLSAAEITGVVVDVHDGDTIKIKIQSTKENQAIESVIPIRLKEIDSPELSQPHGKEAAEALRNKIINQTVTIWYSKKDRYGRILGEIHFIERNINREMVLEGHAWWYRAYSKDPSWEPIEQHAKNNKSGLWKVEKPESPWDYRVRIKRERKKTSTKNKDLGRRFHPMLPPALGPF